MLCILNFEFISFVINRKMMFKRGQRKHFFVRIWCFNKMKKMGSPHFYITWLQTTHFHTGSTTFSHWKHHIFTLGTGHFHIGNTIFSQFTLGTPHFHTGNTPFSHWEGCIFTLGTPHFHIRNAHIYPIGTVNPASGRTPPTTTILIFTIISIKQ